MTTLAELVGARTATLVRDVVGPARARELRAAFEQRGYRRYALLDRASHDELVDPGEPELLASLARLARDATARSLEVAEARVLRLRAGDYVLAHHDRFHDDLPVEVVLDLSATSVPRAEIHYRRRGQVFFRVPCTPGAAALVERGPAVGCNHTYVSKLYPDAEVVRLVVLLRGPR